VQPKEYMSSELNDKKKETFKRDADGMVSTTVRPERALLAQVILDAPRLPNNEIEPDEHSSLDELAGLCEAANAVVVGEVTQRRDRPDPATLLGKGKVQEIEELVREHEADVLVVDCDLSPAQGRNLENALNVRVIDRTELILDIFARRAQTRQAKLQVELAQLRYQLPRLKRMWLHLERIGGGIGLRGPGETQLETDKRLAGDRINLLEKQLDEIRRQKQTESAGRSEFELAALVGYTNVGKSALLNALSSPTGRGVLVANQLFATLGSSTRRLELGGGRAVLLSDTVGFVRRLPHHLVECFHSTLAEVENADVLLRVANGADPELDDKMNAVASVLNELKVGDAPSIMVLNQCDLLSLEDRASLARRYPEAVFTSALTGEGLDELRTRMLEMLDRDAKEVSWVLNGSERTGKLLSEVARHGRILEQEWTADDDGSRVRVRALLAPRWHETLSREATALTP
jgi:GTP-binding protein HflX